MNRTLIFAVLAVVALVSTLLVLLPTPIANNAAIKTGSASSTMIENVYLVKKESGGKRTSGSVLIDNGYIVHVEEHIDAPEGATIIDATGLTVVPGLIDSHTHSYGTALEDALRFGITTSIDMFSPPEMLPAARDQRASVDAVTQTDMFSAGMLATTAGGHGTQFGVTISTLSDPAQAPEWVRERIKEGSDFIKLVYMPYQTRIPSLNREIAKAVIDAAHAEGLMALAHISTQRAALDMVEDGIDGLVHVFADEAVTDEFVELAVKNNLFVIPTLAIISAVAGEDDPTAELAEVTKWFSPMQRSTISTEFPPGIPGFDFQLALNNVERLHKAGVRILAGSDSPNPGTAHGYSLHHELKLLVDAGLSHAEAIHAATELPAAVFKLSARGALAPGKRADMLLVRGNPYQDVRASRQIQHVIKNGHVVTRVESESAKVPAISNSVLGSFDLDATGPDGMSWVATDDRTMNGTSVAQISRVELVNVNLDVNLDVKGDKNRDGYALAVTAEIGNGFAYPWAGAGLGSREPNFALDISAYENIVFEIKGTPGTYRMMLFSGMGAGAPPSRDFEVSDEWQTVSLPIEKFAGFEAAEFSMLSIVPGTRMTAAEYVIDEVRLEP
ncbi:MAG: CIA30 family protein [Gammaproteobacteria bacterium]